MNKYLVLFVLAVSQLTNAEELKLSIDPMDALKVQPVEETWSLQAILSLDSNKYDSKYSSTTIIKGFPSFKECMKAGNRMAVVLNDAVAAIENDSKDYMPAEWGCTKGYSALRGQTVEKVSKTKAQTDRQ